MRQEWGSYMIEMKRCDMKIEAKGAMGNGRGVWMNGGGREELC